MARHEHPPRIHLPRGWPRRVKSAMLHVIALGQYTVAYTRSWAVNGRIAGVRLKAENDHLRQHVTLLALDTIRLALAPIILTIGQYLKPVAGDEHAAVERYYPPAEFDQLAELAKKSGFAAVASGPFVRSSYFAETLCRNG